MRYLTIEQRESLRNVLNQRALALRGNIASSLRGSRDPGCGSLARRIEENFERELDALEGLESEIDGAEVHQEIRQLRRVKDALARLRSPVYGICSDCEGDIPFTRLMAFPRSVVCPWPR